MLISSLDSKLNKNPINNFACFHCYLLKSFYVIIIKIEIYYNYLFKKIISKPVNFKYFLSKLQLIHYYYFKIIFLFK